MKLTRVALVAGPLVLMLASAACMGGGGSSYGSSSTSTPAPTKASASPATTSATTATKAAVTPAASGTSASGTTGSASVNVGDTTIGKVLVDNESMTLYTFKNDVAGSGKSAVPAAILPNWPPLMASASGAATNGTGVTGDLGTASLDDGTKIVTYKGLPLYHFVNDRAVGDTKGDKLGGIWFVALP